MNPGITITFNSVFDPVWSSSNRYIDIWGGRGRGGSHFGTDYFLFLIIQPKYFRGYFVRQTFNDIRDSLFQDFKDRITDNPTVDVEDFHIQENEMRITYIPTGNTIISKGIKKDGSRTAKMKSLAGATHVLIEEADEPGEEDFDQLDISLRTVKSQQVQIIRIFNPPSKNHWIWRDYQLIDSETPGYFKAEARKDRDVLSIFSTYRHNIKNLQASTVELLRRFLETNPEYYYTMVEGLISEGSKGRVYRGWQLIEPCDHEEHCRVYGATYIIDFGYSNDPNALIKVCHHNREVYVRELIYQPGMDNLDLAKRFIDLGITYQDEILADYGAGGDVRIAELIRGFQGVPDYPQLSKGFNVRPVVKTEIATGVNFVKSYNIHYTTDSRNLDTEYQEYKWALDRNKEPTDKPVDKFNHLMDCIRYYCTALVRL